jgi:hypothetical protein
MPHYHVSAGQTDLPPPVLNNGPVSVSVEMGPFVHQSDIDLMTHMGLTARRPSVSREAIDI